MYIISVFETASGNFLFRGISDHTYKILKAVELKLYRMLKCLPTQYGCLVTTTKLKVEKKSYTR